MPEEEDQIDLGAANPDDLAEVAFNSAGDFSGSILPKRPRFMDAAIKIIRKRRANSEALNDPNLISVFLLCERPGNLAERHGAEKVPFFNNGSSNLNGNIWITTAPMTAGYRISVSDRSEGEIFEFIETDLSAGGAPAIIFDPRATQPEIRLYPAGLQVNDVYHCWEIADLELTRENILQVLDRFYETCLRTPECNVPEGRVWKDSDNWIPKKRAESHVQSILTPVLKCVFGAFDIIPEQPTEAGRADIFIVESPSEPGGAHRYHAALELKVLRSFGSTGTRVYNPKIVEAVTKGLTQAIAYREVKHAIHAILCCYDLRKKDLGDICFEHENRRAQKYSVEMRRWYVYNSSDSWRDACYGS